jgi:hypothetical protein
MPKSLMSPKRILPTRMTLHVPVDTDIRFSLLDFPYQNAYNAFIERFGKVYEHRYGKRFYTNRPPTRQLNDSLLSLARSLVQGFEGSQTQCRMITLTRQDEIGRPEDFPSQEQIQNLIRAWLEQWGKQQEIQTLIKHDGKAAWDDLMIAVNGAPETDWRHGIHPSSLAGDLKHENGLAYIALPALLTGLLHQKEITIEGARQPLHLRWRRANDGGKNGLHLITQPLPFGNDFYAFRLDFRVQTQTGYPGFWVFTHLSVQRYITEPYRGGDGGRSISILVGFNKESFNGRWDDDTTLLRLGVKKYDDKAVWQSGVANLLQGFGSPLPNPSEILQNPYRYGNYKGKTGWNSNEYYAVYAEGRKFGEEHGRKHELTTGISLRNRSLIMENVLSSLNHWLEVSPPLEFDTQNPVNTLALRDYAYMVNSPRKDNSKQAGSWRTALETSLTNGSHGGVHIVIAHRDESFRRHAEAQIREALMGVDIGDHVLATVTCAQVSPLLSAPLDPGDLDPKKVFLPASQKLPGFDKKWEGQMRTSYSKKRKEWQEFLQNISWQPNARRLILIDSTGENRIPHEQKIKGAVRDACVREGVSSQFLIGNFEDREKLEGERKGRLQNAVLDLLLRQQGILYALPSEIYEFAAKLNAETAKQLDVIAFCRVGRTFPKINYILAVRLRATGEVDVLLPDEGSEWMPYDMAAHQVGKVFSASRIKTQREDNSHPLYLNNIRMIQFVEHVLTECFERPTIAVIEAQRWRDGRGNDEQKHCWTQLQNPNLSKNQNVLDFESINQRYERHSLKLDRLLAVVRLRMDSETPQYITADTWADENPMRDIEHLTGYIDLCVTSPMHYMSIAGLSDGQKDQRNKDLLEAFKGDARNWKDESLAYKHPQIVELVPFFVHPHYQSEEGMRQLCRCVHFLRNSPSFMMSEILSPYPMHIGESIIEDMLCIIGADE